MKEKIKKVIKWVKANKQDPMNGIEEIELILNQTKESESVEGFFDNNVFVNEALRKGVSIDIIKKIATQYANQPKAKGVIDGKMDFSAMALKIEQPKAKEVSDEEIEDEAWERYGLKEGGQYHADRPYNRKCFTNGAKWMREQLTKKD